MSAALVIMILAAFGLVLASIVLALYVTRAIVVTLARFVQHEMLMRPKERYYRM